MCGVCTSGLIGLGVSLVLVVLLVFLVLVVFGVFVRITPIFTDFLQN